MRRLVLYFHAFPECNVVLDLFGGVFGFGVVPGGSGVLLAVDLKVVITGGAFPGADRARGAGLEVFFVNRVGRKVLVAFDFDGFVAFGEDCAFPRCFCHNACLDS
jgi:hypothetical protein